MPDERQSAGLGRGLAYGLARLAPALAPARHHHRRVRALLRDQHGVAVDAGARRASDSAVVRRLLDEVAFEVKHLDAVVLAVGHDDLVAVWVAADVVRQAAYAAATFRQII